MASEPNRADPNQGSISSPPPPSSPADPSSRWRSGRGLWSRLPAPWRPLLLLAPIAAALLVRGLLNTAPAPSRRPPPLVQTAPVVLGSMEERYPVSAEVKPLVSVEVRPEVSGTIQRLFFQEGTEVRRGDPLALINPTPYQVALDQARANTSRARARIGEAQAQRRLAEAQLRLASDRARRYVGLSRQGALSRDDEENYRTQELVARANLSALEGSAASAEAELAAARAAEAAARLNLDHTLLRAPISGRIGQQRISPGNLVREQEGKPLVVINQTSPLDAVFGIPQRWEERIQVGQRLRIEGRPGLVGRIVSLDNTTNASTGTVLAKARLEGNTAGLTPGETVNASLLVRRLDGALLLPSRAVQRGQQGPFVYGARGGKAVLVPVKVLASDGRRTAVEADLQPGEPVVVAGQFALMPGGPLRTEADRKASGAGGSGEGQPGSGSAAGNRPRQQRQP
ncbi:efflux RND transporter periplasmic adaptor subunit [Vulcanococcus limneticus]|uniref:efflux RND transporter periplasmic adaptor subunit n=1 Tax=Vulcanococcus limneticus TaxID=2170428 RepID=UPI00398BEE53